MKRIVIIDDDEDFLEWLSTGLTRDGYDIVTAMTGKEGLALLQSRLPDVAIVDISLPDMDGFEICARIKNDPAASAVRIILVTGVFKEVEAKEKGYRAGADDFLVKPFSYEQLSIRVMHQIREKEEQN
ncbi:MAG: response regulator transcription factor [Endomicrobiales bacterium]